MNADALALPTGAAGRVAVVLRRRRTIGRIDAVGIAAPTAIALSILSGILYATGFPPLSWSIAPWLALVPLLVASAVLSPLRAAMAGMCWAMSVAAGVAWFLPAMLSGYDERTHRTAGDAAARFERHARVTIRGRAEPVDVYALPLAVA